MVRGSSIQSAVMCCRMFSRLAIRELEGDQNDTIRAHVDPLRNNFKHRSVRPMAWFVVRVIVGKDERREAGGRTVLLIDGCNIRCC